MRKVIKLLNQAFVASILFVFYLLVIGFVFIIYRLRYIFDNPNEQSYWQNPSDVLDKKNYFSSPY